MHEKRWLLKLSIGLPLLCLGALLLGSITALTQDESILEGEFEATIIIDPTATWDIDLASVLTLSFTRGGWQLNSASVFTESGWENQIFSSQLVSGAGIFMLNALFIPSTPEFYYADLVFQMTTLGVDINTGVRVEDDGAGLWFRLNGASASGIPWDMHFLFGVDQYHSVVQTGCDVAFTGAEIEMEFPLMPCCPGVQVKPLVSFTDAGFEAMEVDFTITDIPWFEWLYVQGTLTYAIDEKTLDFSFGASPGDSDFCIDFSLALEINDPDPEIESIRVAGLRLICEFGGINFRAESYPGSGMGPNTYLRRFSSNLSGSYWETYHIWTQEEGCCGPFEFEVAVYFDEAGTKLMDLAAMQALFAIQIAPNFKFGTAMEFDFEVADPWVYWDFYFEVGF